MDIQLLNPNQTNEAAPLCVSLMSDARTSVESCTRHAKTGATAIYCAAHAANTGVTGTNGFWLNAPIFGMKRNSRWKRPD